MPLALADVLETVNHSDDKGSDKEPGQRMSLM
jgi:hypothetical protein